MSGQVYLDGNDISTLNLKWLRAQIGLVSQEPTLFAGSVYDNVSYGLTNTPYEDEPEEKKRERVVKACKVANADGFIQALSDGYDTLVGERGLLMSGGQAQRIAIARAIIAEPPILVLDEATSALDVTSERLVQKALNQASIGRTTIAIAHRLSTIVDADQIIVMNSGRIVEKGTHASLLQNKDSVYASLVALQSLREETESSDTSDKKMEANADAQVDVPVLARTATAFSVGAVPKAEDGTSAKMGLFRIICRVVQENRGIRWIYILALAGCAVSGTAYPVSNAQLPTKTCNERADAVSQATSLLFGALLATFSDRPADQWQSRNNYLAGCMFAV